MESDAWKGWDLWSWYAESTSGESQNSPPMTNSARLRNTR